MRGGIRKKRFVGMGVRKGNGGENDQTILYTCMPLSKSD